MKAVLDRVIKLVAQFDYLLTTSPLKDVRSVCEILNIFQLPLGTMNNLIFLQKPRRFLVASFFPSNFLLHLNFSISLAYHDKLQRLVKLKNL